MYLKQKFVIFSILYKEELSLLSVAIVLRSQNSLVLIGI